MVLNGGVPLVRFVDAIFGDAADRVLVRFTRRRHFKMPPMANNYDSIRSSKGEMDKRVGMGKLGASRIVLMKGLLVEFSIISVLGYTLSILLGSIISNPDQLVFGERRLRIPCVSVVYCC